MSRWFCDSCDTSYHPDDTCTYRGEKRCPECFALVEAYEPVDRVTFSPELLGQPTFMASIAVDEREVPYVALLRKQAG